MSKEFLSDEAGFNSLSPGAQEIARYHDSHGGNIAGALKENPALIDSLDEYYKWTAVTLADIDGKDSLPTHTHSLKKVLKKNKK
jgi:hypothetical protein